MVKLASARDRESRLYGPWVARNRWEYINAGLYVFASILLLSGFVSQISDGSAKSGLVVLLISLALITVVNVHDLLAHMAVIDYRWPLIGLDTQLALVEFAVPIVQAFGSVLSILGILFFLIQVEKGSSYFRLEKHALNLLIAGPVLWVIGSIHNACQIYKRADGHIQILQESVHIPFLMGSLLFLVGAVVNSRDHIGFIHHGLRLLGSLLVFLYSCMGSMIAELILQSLYENTRHNVLLHFYVQGKDWVWLGIFGSVLFVIGGFMNLVKVFKMQQMDGISLEKLRGGAQERLYEDREGQVPLILEEQGRKKQKEEARPISIPTPYKDVLVGRS